MDQQVTEMTQAELRRKTRRSFLIGGVAAAAGVAGYSWMQSHQDDSDTPIAQRRVLDFNARLAKSYLSDRHRMPEYPASRIEYQKANGNIGMTGALDDWGLDVITNAGPKLTLGLSDVQALPPVQMITRFCCIEGWSAISQWKGIRFADFTKKFFPAGSALPPYVSMISQDEDYFVGLDTKSALHPQTLLAWELNGQLLKPEHGAPLRLVIPVKYGIKNIKKIGSIEYTSKRPGDYWADEGYDWFAGL